MIVDAERAGSPRGLPTHDYVTTNGYVIIYASARTSQREWQDRQEDTGRRIDGNGKESMLEKASREQASENYARTWTRKPTTTDQRRNQTYRLSESGRPGHRGELGKQPLR